MSSITPISLGVDLATFGRNVDPVSRPAGRQVEPVVQPPAVILPRTAAWLNVSIAPELTPSDSAESGQPGADQSGSSATTDVAAQPSLVASLNAQGAVAAAASATASGQSASQDGQAAGFGSVVQLV